MNRSSKILAMVVVALSLAGVAFQPPPQPPECVCEDLGLIQSQQYCSSSRVATSTLTCTAQTVGLPCLIGGSVTVQHGTTSGCVDNSVKFVETSCSTQTSACVATTPYTWYPNPNNPTCPSTGSCGWLVYIPFYSDSACSSLNLQAEYIHAFTCRP